MIRILKNGSAATRYRAKDWQKDIHAGTRSFMTAPVAARWLSRTIPACRSMLNGKPMALVSSNPETDWRPRRTTLAMASLARAAIRTGVLVGEPEPDVNLRGQKATA